MNKNPTNSKNRDIEVFVFVLRSLFRKKGKGKKTGFKRARKFRHNFLCSFKRKIFVKTSRIQVMQNSKGFKLTPIKRLVLLNLGPRALESFC